MTHLYNEKSPYLLQHIDNPVAWYPWGEAAFQRAQAENRLISLSIGYSTDRMRLVLHFEKMLYDQAGLLRTYLVAWQAVGNPLYKQSVREILDYLQRDMTTVDGRAAAYVCQGFSCRAPVTTDDELQEILESAPQS